MANHKTDGEGLLVIPGGFVAGRQYVIRRWKDPNSWPAQWPEDGREELRFPKARTTPVHVQNGQGRPLGGMLIRLRNAPLHWMFDKETANTDEHGLTELLLPVGREVQAQVAGLGVDADVRLIAPQTERIELPVQGVDVVEVDVLHEGQAVQRALVEVYVAGMDGGYFLHRQSHADELGRAYFSCLLLESEHVVVARDATAGLYGEVRGTVADRTNRVVLAVSRGEADVFGRLDGPRDRTAPELRVTLKGERGVPVVDVALADDGAFEVLGLPTGRWTLKIDVARDGGWAEHSGVPLTLHGGRNEGIRLTVK